MAFRGTVAICFYISRVLSKDFQGLDCMAKGSSIVLAIYSHMETLPKSD